MKYILTILIFFLYENSFSQNEQINKILATYQESYNNRDWNSFSEIITEDLTINNNFYCFSIIQAFQVISYKQLGKPSEKITKIEVLSTKWKKDSSQCTIEIKRFFSEYKDDKPITFSLIKSKANNYKINYFSLGFIPSKMILPISTYGLDPDLFDMKRIEYFDCTSELFQSKKYGDVYFEPEYEKYVERTNSYITQIKTYLNDSLEINKLADFSMYLAKGNDSITIIYTNDDSKKDAIFQVDNLGDNDSINQREIKREIYSVYAHEYAEGNLHENTGIWILNNRWYADGFSEYVSYKICKMYDKWHMEDEFLRTSKGKYISRYQEYLKDKQKDNLLDWVASRASQNQFPLIGKHYTYDDDSGQYGRAFWFFKEFIEQYGEKTLIEIHLHFKGKNEVTQKQLLDYMSEITGEDIKTRVSRY